MVIWCCESEHSLARNFLCHIAFHQLAVELVQSRLDVLPRQRLRAHHILLQICDKGRQEAGRLACLLSRQLLCKQASLVSDRVALSPPHS